MALLLCFWALSGHQCRPLCHSPGLLQEDLAPPAWPEVGFAVPGHKPQLQALEALQSRQTKCHLQPNSRQIHVSVLAGPGCFGSARCWLPGMATCDFQGETFPSFWRLSQAKPLKRLVSTPTVTALRDLPFLAAFANVTGIKNNGRNPRTGIASSLAKTGRGPSSAARAHGRSKEQPPAHHKAPRGQALSVPHGFSCLPKGPGSQG